MQETDVALAVGSLAFPSERHLLVPNPAKDDSSKDLCTGGQARRAAVRWSQARRSQTKIESIAGRRDRLLPAQKIMILLLHS